MTRVALIDCDDSFTLNIMDYLASCGLEVSIIHHSAIHLESLKNSSFRALVLSPGPNRPNDFPILNTLIEAYWDKIPMLGICLGHQALGQFFGYELAQSIEPLHGVSTKIFYNEDIVFDGIDRANFYAMRYNSLTLIPKKSTKFIPICHSISNEIMGCKHQDLPIYSYQFHPESVGTPQGKQLMENWTKSLQF